jgi:hypothetical protein
VAYRDQRKLSVYCTSFPEASRELRWLETRKLSCGLDFVVPINDGFYLIGETKSPQQGPPTSFTVTRVTVSRWLWL